jgi:hypothetical protein
VEAALRGLARVRRRTGIRVAEATEGLLVRARAGIQFLASKFTLDLRIGMGPVEAVESIAAAGIVREDYRDTCRCRHEQTPSPDLDGQLQRGKCRDK